MKKWAISLAVIVPIIVIAAVVGVTVFLVQRKSQPLTNGTSSPQVDDPNPSTVVGSTCTKLVPGLTKLPRGIDVTTLDLLPLDLSASHGYKQPIIDFYCDERKKWTQNGETYDIPDQVSAITPVPGGWLSSQVEIYKDFREVKRSMSTSAGLEATFSKGMFSASGSYKKMQHSITNTSSYVEKVSAFDSANRVDLVPHWGLRLARYPQDLLDDLPDDFESAVSRYNEFIQYYGTHFFKNVQYGGIINLIIETKSSYYYGKSDSQVKAQASGSFLGILKANGGYNGATSTVDVNFESSSTKTVQYYGGSTNLLSSSGMEAWQPTVAANPWLFSGELIPISNLISDPTKKESMERAVGNHLNKALLKEYERLLQAADAQLPASRVAIQDLISRVSAALVPEIVSQSEVDNLGDDIVFHTEIPSWFSQRSQLCYRWYPDGDGGQCGGGASRLLCARPGQRTAVYRDDSDGRGGGCRMGWGITSEAGHDPWFENAEICYRWHPDGDGGQCGGGAPREMCAKVGSYTSYYRDDTDSRGGGCQMSWRIKIPNDAPLWMKNVQLCYYWYPDGDGGQCGGGADRTLCARANSWTAYYRDDSDGRPGGCRMSWEIKMP